MIVYLSGPITGITEHNEPLFTQAASVLMSRGYSVLNPLDNFSGRLDLSRVEYMRVDVGLLLAAKTVVVLPGWQGSKGCRTEVQVAFEIGTPVMAYRGYRQELQPIEPFDLTDGWSARQKMFVASEKALYAYNPDTGIVKEVPCRTT
jgi:hypothetical protein